MEPANQIDTNSLNENLDFQIYMICSQQTSQVYIGSTKQTLEARFSKHKSGAKGSNNCNLECY